MHGIGHTGAWIPSGPLAHLPEPVLGLLRDARGIRVPLASGSVAPLDLPAAVVVWRPARLFSAETGWRHAVDPAAVARIEELLDGFPLPPAFLVDGQHELVGVWPLAEPLPVDRDPGQAVQLLEALAARLGGDVEAARDVRGTIPLCGIVRNWNTTPPALVEILPGAPAATYTVAALLEAAQKGAGQ
jgi:hypothetical protein